MVVIKKSDAKIATPPKKTIKRISETSPSKKKPKLKKEPSPKVPPQSVEVKNDEEEDYQRLELIDHIYRIPDTYIGSDQQTERETWFYDLDKGESIASTTTLPQGIERVFLEILSNAGDNALRSMAEGIDPGTIDVTMDSHWVTVRNGGKPIRIRINQKEQMWNPQMIFGTLLTSSNYDTTKKRVGCGRNGYGGKLTNIFSKNFIVTVGDPERGLHYQQEWSDNMKTQSEPNITKGYKGEAFVEIKYLLDFQRFGYSVETGYPKDAFGLFARSVYDYSENIHIPTSFNGINFEPSPDPKDHGRFYFGDVPMIIHYEWPAGTEIIHRKNGLEQAKDPLVLPTSVLILADTPGSGTCVSFANGIMTSEGGVHVNEALKVVSKPLLDTINTSRASSKKGKEEKAKLTWKDVKNHLSILLVCHLDDPQFGGQMKEKLVKPTPKFYISEKTLAPIAKWDLVSHLLAMMESKIGKLLSNSDGKKRRNINSGKGIDANEAGGPRSQQCMLFGVEGDSAKNYASIAQGLIPDGPDYVGIMPFKGKLLNVTRADPITISENKEIIEFKKFTGIQEFTDYTDERNFAKLRYGHFVILADADDDGIHIKSLLINLFHTFYPSLLEIGYVSFLKTPIVRILGTELVFYSEVEYRIWQNKTPNYQKYGYAKYYKGLSSSQRNDVAADFKNPLYVKCIYDHDDETFTASQALDLVFNSKRSDDRKTWLREWNYTLEELNIGRLEELRISEFIDKELAVYAQTSLRRAIPSLMDGLKDSQRKILWGAYLIWGGNKQNTPTKKVSGLGAFIVDKLEYLHGEDCLNKAIMSMMHDFVGSNNMNYLFPDGLMGTRMEGGKDDSAGRYVCTKLEWWFPYVFKDDDIPLLEFREEEGKTIEPKFMLPILPMEIINGAHGIGTSTSTHIPNHDPLDVSNWFKARLKGEELPKIIPWYKGFIGDLSIKIKKRKQEEHDEEIYDEDQEKSKEFFDEDEEHNTPGLTLVTKGRFEHRDGKLLISELPIGKWTIPYKKWLEDLVEKKEIKSMNWKGDVDNVRFEVVGFRNASHKTLHLQKSYGMTNMVLLDKNDKPIKHKSISVIMETFYQERLPYFEARRKGVLAKYLEDIAKLDAKARYIQAIQDKIIDLNADNQVIEEKLSQLQIPNWVRDITTRTLARQHVNKFYEKIESLKAECAEYAKKTKEDLWFEDLLEFDKVWSAREKQTAKKAKIVRK